MKIAIIGYGKMGRAIEEIAISRGHVIAEKFNSQNPVNKAALENCDVAIEFTRPDIVIQNLDICAEANCPVVVGTTGWYEHFEPVRQKFSSGEQALIYGTNFSLGVNIVFFVNEILAKIMSGQNGYAASVTEIHHTQKLDAPSGTAISLAQGIIENNPKFSNWKLSEGAAESGELPIYAIREGQVPGTHHVVYSGDIDSITLSHEAHNRKGFALGSVIAAEWLKGKNGVFSMRDMLNFDALIH